MIDNKTIRYVYRELNSFRWPDCLPLKPDDWVDSAPYKDLSGSHYMPWRKWKETEAGKTQTAIMNHLEKTYPFLTPIIRGR